MPKRKPIRVELSEHNTVTPEAYDLPLECSDVVELGAWVDRVRDLYRVVDSLDRIVMLYEDSEGHLCLATLPKVLEVPRGR